MSAGPYFAPLLRSFKEVEMTDIQFLDWLIDRDAVIRPTRYGRFAGWRDGSGQVIALTKRLDDGGLKFWVRRD